MERVMQVLVVVLLGWGTQFTVAFVRARRADRTADRARAVARLRRGPDRPGFPQRGPAWAVVGICAFIVAAAVMAVYGFFVHLWIAAAVGTASAGYFAWLLLTAWRTTYTFHPDRLARRGWHHTTTVRYADITSWKLQNPGNAIPDPGVVVLTDREERTIRVSTLTLRSSALADRLEELDAAEAAQP